MKKMNRKKFILIFIIAALTVALSGCSFSDVSSDKRDIPTEYESSDQADNQPVTDTAEDTSTEAVTETEISTAEEKTQTNTEESTVEGTAEKTTVEKNTTSEEKTDDKISKASDTDSEGLDYDNIPEYDGKAFIDLNNNIPFFSDSEKKNTEDFEKYSELDSFGRCGVAFANICKEIMPTEERGEIGDIKPTGWHTIKYPEVIADNYLYNRSHLIAFSFAGENDNEKNLITGTRYLNQDTMQIFELKVLDYVRSTENHVLYRVTPVFEGENLLANGVQMEAWSVEDDGKGICFNVFCYNVQPGIEIDYATGDSNVAPSTEAETTSESETSETTTEKQIDDSESVCDFEKKQMKFILNKRSMKIHLPACKSVGDMAEHNKLEYEGTLLELKNQGYEPCGRCLAEYR